MPLYESSCAKCGTYHTYVRTVANCLDTPECCGVKTDKRIFSAPMATFDIQTWDAYESPATGKIISSKKQRLEDMKVSGCREWEGIESERKESAKKKADDEKKLDESLDKTVRQAWAGLSPAKKAAALASCN